MKLSAEQIAKIKEDFPPEALSVDNSRGFPLTSIKAMYVIERLNTVFGVLGWGYEFSDPVLRNEEYTAKVKLIIYDEQHQPYHEISQFGGKKIVKDHYTDAYKSAITDGLTKAASILGIGHKVFKGEKSNGQAPPAISFNLDDKIGGGGKHKNEKWAKVDINYLEWCLKSDKIPQAFKDKCRKALKLRKGSQPIEPAPPIKALQAKKDKKEVEYTVKQGSASWLYEVHKSDGTIYDIDRQKGTCSCPSGSFHPGKPCKHIPLVQTYIARQNKSSKAQKEVTPTITPNNEEKPVKYATKAMIALLSHLGAQAKLSPATILDMAGKHGCSKLEELTFSAANEIIDELRGLVGGK